MQPSAGLHIAAQIDSTQHDVSLYHEMWHGTMDTALLGRYNLVFLTGLQKDFDRMRQLSYFFRRQGAITIAGGSICTLFPEFSSDFFDVVCAGSVDSVRTIMADYSKGNLQSIYNHRSTQITAYRVPYQLLTAAGIIPPLHLIEASRGCNFKCDFCIIPAEKAAHSVYGVEHVMECIHASIAASPRFSFKRLYPSIWFIDNNFANNLPYTRELCAALKKDPKVKVWGALVTQDVIGNQKILELMAKSKCRVLFTGLESLDTEFLISHKKFQNLKKSDSFAENVRYAQTLGIIVNYGYLFDPRISTIEDMKRQMHAITLQGLAFPNFFSYVSPLLGTPLFWSVADEGGLRKNLGVRDLEGESIAYNDCLSSDEELIEFSDILYNNTDKLLDKVAFYKTFFKGLFNLNPRYPILWYLHYENSHRVKKMYKKRSKTIVRNYIGGKDYMESLYECYPPDISEQDRRRYFDPIKVTDEDGKLMPWLAAYRPGVEEKRMPMSYAIAASDAIAATTVN